jgi:hypothetical protein
MKRAPIAQVGQTGLLSTASSSSYYRVYAIESTASLSSYYRVYVNTSRTPDEVGAHSPSWPNGLREEKETLKKGDLR